MPDNRFKNNDDEFERIFNNKPRNDEYEDIYSHSPDFSSDNGSAYYENRNEYYSQNNNYQNSDPNIHSNTNYQVNYNSSFQNRRRQEIYYDDVSQVYGDLSADESPKKKKKKKHHPIRNTFIVLLCLVLVTVSCVGFYGYQKVDNLLSLFDTDEPLEENNYIEQSLLYSDKEQINILLVGVDAREGETASRSDTMMLVTLDNKNGQIKLTSFLRDSYVEIAGRKNRSKLNSAFFYGGIQTLADTLELNFKVDIQYYMMVDFEIFTTVVDEIGGINVAVTEKESRHSKKEKNDGKLIVIESGDNVLLNGEQALWYSRMRHLDSDFMRTQRQRKVITAIIQKALTLEITELYSLAEKIIPLIKTNMTSDNILKIGIDAIINKAYSYSTVQQQIPAPGTWSDKNISGVGASLVMDMKKNVTILHDFLSEKQEAEESTSTN